MSDDGNTRGDSSASGGDEDVAKRRSKNRVNARRSRERKRLMLDTLQQEHWQLHQENQRIKGENTKLREAINTIKALQRKKAASQPAAANKPPAFQAQLAAAPAPGAPPSGTPLLDMLAQHLLRNQANQSNGSRQAAAPANPPQNQNDALASLLLSKLLGNGQAGAQPAPQPAPAPPPMAPAADNNALLAVGLGALIAAMTGNQNGGPQNSALGQPNLLALLQLLGRHQQAAQQAPAAGNGASNNGHRQFNNARPVGNAQQLRSQNFAGKNGQHVDMKDTSNNSSQQASLSNSNRGQPYRPASAPSNGAAASGTNMGSQHSAYNGLAAGSMHQQSSVVGSNATSNNSSMNGKGQPDLVALLQVLSQSNRNSSAGQPPLAFANNLAEQLSHLQHQAQPPVGQSGEGQRNGKSKLH